MSGFIRTSGNVYNKNCEQNIAISAWIADDKYVYDMIELLSVSYSYFLIIEFFFE